MACSRIASAPARRAAGDWRNRRGTAATDRGRQSRSSVTFCTSASAAGGACASVAASGASPFILVASRFASVTCSPLRFHASPRRCRDRPSGRSSTGPCSGPTKSCANTTSGSDRPPRAPRSLRRRRRRSTPRRRTAAIRRHGFSSPMKTCTSGLASNCGKTALKKPPPRSSREHGWTSPSPRSVPAARRCSPNPECRTAVCSAASIDRNVACDLIDRRSGQLIAATPPAPPISSAVRPRRSGDQASASRLSGPAQPSSGKWTIT